MLDELSKRPRSVSEDIIRRSDTPLGHAVFDLTVLLQAVKARDEGEKQAQAPKMISVSDLAARLTE